MNAPLRIVLILLGVSGTCALFFALHRYPRYVSDANYLGPILIAEIVLASLYRFEKVFFPMTMGCFIWTATDLPGSGEGFTVRWFFLAVGALAGLIVWIKTSRDRHFGTFHLVALFCVLAALASASASAEPITGVLKAASLFLLFLYAATGGRVALANRERSFMRGLLLASEVLVFIVSSVYFAGFNIFGNPNNLGAVIGVGVAPLLLWAVLTAESRGERQRAGTALALCGVLLFLTVCRAAIVADVIVTILLTLALRRPGLLLRAAFAGALFLEIIAVANPSKMSEFMDSLSGRLILKIRTHGGTQGAFGSRESPWDDTIAAVKQHPWFGTGFGTSDVDAGAIQESSIYTMEGTNREHGSSYLAMAEYMGLLGILPFLLLLVLVIRAAARAFAWMRRTGTPDHYSVPFAMVIMAGLIHAGFEDWLFAAGSYLCLFFWVSAFLLVDLVSEMDSGPQTTASRPFFRMARMHRFPDLTP